MINYQELAIQMKDKTQWKYGVLFCAYTVKSHLPSSISTKWLYQSINKQTGRYWVAENPNELRVKPLYSAI